MIKYWFNLLLADAGHWGGDQSVWPGQEDSGSAPPASPCKNENQGYSCPKNRTVQLSKQKVVQLKFSPCIILEPLDSLYRTWNMNCKIWFSNNFGQGRVLCQWLQLLPRQCWRHGWATHWYDCHSSNVSRDHSEIVILIGASILTVVDYTVDLLRRGAKKVATFGWNLSKLLIANNVNFHVLLRAAR